jgi:ClpX C4-type zinc finger
MLQASLRSIGIVSDDETPNHEIEIHAVPRQTARLMAAPWSPFGVGGSRRCSFCRRREDSVRYLVRSRDAYVCDECIALAAEAIAAAPSDRKLLRIRPRGTAPGDRDAAEAEVEYAFETAIGGDTPDDDRLQLIEGGSNLRAALLEVRERLPGNQRPDVFVEFVRFLGDDEAEVHFVLVFNGGTPAARFPDVGHAVLSDGRWKVARETWCRLVGRVGVECPPME